MMWIWIAIGVCIVSVIFVAAAGYMYTRKNAATKDPPIIDENSKLINSGRYLMELISFTNLLLL
jgi:hypothetical protein